MNSTTPKRHAETLQNQNVPFQSKNRNGNRNSIDNYERDRRGSEEGGEEACRREIKRREIEKGGLQLTKEGADGCNPRRDKIFGFFWCLGFVVYGG